jgi:hypothetical protein
MEPIRQPVAMMFISRVRDGDSTPIKQFISGTTERLNTLTPRYLVYPQLLQVGMWVAAFTCETGMQRDRLARS